MITTRPPLPSPPDEVPAVRGRRAVSFKGWLFDTREFEPLPNPTPTDLDAIVTDLTTTAATCAAIGLDYLPVIVPAKRNLVGVAPSSERGWVAGLNARLRDADDVELLTLLPVLRHAARHGRCYHRTDADWNDLGAFFIARALLKEAHKRVPTLRPPALADLHLRPVPGYRGTLIAAPKLQLLDGELIGCEPEIEAEDGVVIDASRLHALRMPVESHLARAGSTSLRVYANGEREEDTRVAVVGDSAALSVVAWLAERARRTTFFDSQTLPITQLELELPLIVVHLIRETDLLIGWPPGKETTSEPALSLRPPGRPAETGLG